MSRKAGFFPVSAEIGCLLSTPEFGRMAGHSKITKVRNMNEYLFPRNYNVFSSVIYPVGGLSERVKSTNARAEVRGERRRCPRIRVSVFSRLNSSTRRKSTYSDPGKTATETVHTTRWRLKTRPSSFLPNTHSAMAGRLAARMRLRDETNRRLRSESGESGRESGIVTRTNN